MSIAPGPELGVAEHLARLGGVGRWGRLVDLTSRRQLDEAVLDETVIRVARGRYALPSAKDAQMAAARLSGVAVGRSAAAHWGWAMKWQPPLPVVAVPRGRRVAPDLQRAYDVTWRTIDPLEIVDGWVTGRVRTVVDCLRMLPFDEALAIADSALRSGDVSRSQLRQAADESPARGHAAAVRVAELADHRSANPFESVLLAIALDVPGLTVVPQVRVEAAVARRRADGRPWVASPLALVREPVSGP